jgi:hypothetical protein
MYNTINVVFFQYYNIVWFAIDHFLSPNSVRNWGRRVRMVVGFTTTLFIFNSAVILDFSFVMYLTLQAGLVWFGL